MKTRALLDPFATRTVRLFWERDSREAQLEADEAADDSRDGIRGNAEYLNRANSPGVALRARGKRGLLTEVST